MRTRAHWSVGRERYHRPVYRGVTITSVQRILFCREERRWTAADFRRRESPMVVTDLLKLSLLQIPTLAAMYN